MRHQHKNNVLSTILAPIIRTLAEKNENRAIASTEEMIATIKKANEKIRVSTRKIGIGSMDCKAFYPSLSREWVKKIILQTMEETNVIIKVDDWRELALYIALTHKQEEIDIAGWSNVIHKRRHKGGPRPGITTPRAFSLLPENEEEDKWKQPERAPTEEEKKKMLAMAIVKGVVAVMANHLQF